MTVDPLAVDLYVGDLNGNPDVAKLVAAGRPWCALNLKATQGTFYPNLTTTNPRYSPVWFQKYWPLTASLAGERLGVDWFRQEYHYADLAHDPVAQARWNISTVVHAGGFGSRGDLPPMVDIEDADNPPNLGKTATERWIKTFADEIYAQLGVRPILYGNNYLHENHVDFKNCGCLSLEVARYTATLPPETYTGIGCPLSSLSGWQYIGDNPTPVPKGYPVYTPLSSTHTEDITAIVMNDSQGFEASLQWMRDHCIRNLPWGCANHTT